MKSILNITLISLAMIFVTTLHAQDTIKKKNGEVLKVVVKEINDSQIKYYHFDDPNQVLFTLDRIMVTEIKFSYGREYKEEEPIMTKDYFEDDADLALKINISSMLFDAAILSFEKITSLNTSVEASIKKHGIGFGPYADNYYDRNGFGAELGYKVKFGGKKKKKWQYRPDHLLSGGYIMPHIGFDIIKRDSDFYEESSKVIHIGSNFGKVHVIQDLIIFEYYAGFSFYGGSQKQSYTYNGSDEVYDLNGINAGDMFGGNNFAVTLGIKMGLGFGKYGSKEDNKKRR